MTGAGGFSLRVDAHDAGSRLDVVVAARLPARSRSLAAQLIHADRVLVDGRPRKPGYRLKPGETIAVQLPELTPPAFLPEPIPLHILYEDAHIVVVDKQPGLVVHPAPGHYSGTLVNALLFHCPDLAGVGMELRPGIVHRLDKDTSGTLVVAKNGAALQRLASQFKARSVAKHYLALVHGGMASDSGTIRLPIGRHPVDRKRMSTVSRTPRAAETRWRVARRFGCASLLEVTLHTGRTHQIRVHLAALRHPIVGDPVYGSRRAGRQPAANGSACAQRHTLLADAPRQMLHAWRLAFVHPASGERIQFEAPLPQDMAALIQEWC
jgi:23S rRNA pseudouridine1911/1915/1917 synthase